jgi:prepilin-type N-terminal cleavage/methylation domain-containing protein
VRTKGLTLVEILIALAVLSITLAVFTASMGSSLDVSRRSRIDAIASEYAQSVLERYRVHWSNPDNFARGRHPDLPADLQNRLSSTGLRASISTPPPVNPDGSAFTGRTAPPLRRVVVEVYRGGQLMTRLSGEIGNPRP